ncbi:MAG: type II secretion system GspH family protein [Candidatus Omnitrophica bacterium]|nr:type II secretion system GspH family protein [Candidatus Omnitrophota bacterium]MBU4478536.1 type II secretion system GspH family protein [Candidatus Omnitrophota bacterium]MCG2702867.1 type II secretion system GspH family protein [Candidatus Omnitrophota bacterium]
MRTNGFTLIELLIVVLVIGILVSFALPTYLRAIERTKAGKAKQSLAAIRSTETWYRAHMDQYCDDITLLLDWGLPLPAIQNDTDWDYTVPVAGAITLQVTATRANGPFKEESISIDENGNLTVSAPNLPWDVK